MNTSDAQAWFTKTTSFFQLGGSANRAWLFAWRVYEAHDAEPERWKAWIRKCVNKAKGPNVDSPSGLLLTLLERGPEKPLGASAPRYPDLTGDCERARQERAEMPAERPSLAEAVRALKHGGETALHEYLAPYREQEKTCVTTI
ncbi:MAG: hypothetical protein GY856_36920 [bacterium]|nr:hypothetical protein [bacterium]